MAFLTESEYLIHLISCTVKNQKPEEMPSNLSFEKVYKIGLAHDVSNIAFYSLEKLLVKPEVELYSKWESRKNILISRDFNQSFAREEILDLFKKNNIESIEVQGTEVKKLYPAPEYRSMSDIDFIVRKEDLKKAEEVLSVLGYEYYWVGDSEIDAKRSPNIFIEVHTDYFPADSKYVDILPKPFSDERDNWANIFYAYNILHVAKHYFGRGCGIRRVLDVYYLNKNFGDKIDKDFIKAVFEKAEIVDFVKDITELSDCWFSDKSTPAHLKDMESFILCSHLHGTEKNFMYNQLRNTYGEGAKLSRTRYFLRMIFPKKSVLSKSYPSLNKTVLVYPFCLIHRFFSKLFNKKKRKRVFQDIKNIVKSNFDKRI